MFLLHFGMSYLISDWYFPSVIDILRSFFHTPTRVFVNNLKLHTSVLVIHIAADSCLLMFQSRLSGSFLYE